MEIIQKSSPHLRRPMASVVRMMRDVAIALSPLVIFAIVQYGLAAVSILLAAVLSMVATEYLYYQVQDFKARKFNNTEFHVKLAALKKEKEEKQKSLTKEDFKAYLTEYKSQVKEVKEQLKTYASTRPTEENLTFKLKNKSFTLYNFTVIVSGLIYGLTIPDATPILVVIIGGVVGVFLAKLIFGGMGQNVFNIAAFARIFIALSFGGAVAVSNIFIDSEVGATVLGALMLEPFADVTSNYTVWRMFTGIGIPGALGETSALLILLGGAYLLFRKSFDVFIPLTYIATVFVLSLAIMFTQDLGMYYPLTHVLAGGLLFGAIYMATDPITSPTTRPGRLYFAFGLGVITFVIRLFGSYPEGVAFSLLIMNMFVPAIDYPKWAKSRFSKRGVLIFIAVILVTIISVTVGANYVG
ncbi:MAG: RnfABCDGE type electron transport complex subunit D [Candidatus Izemoplasmataceae bacterium]